MIKLYGIPNCDTVKKARKYLENKNIEYKFIDFKKMPPDDNFLKNCYKFFGDWPVNPRGRTYRQFKDEFLNANESKKLSLMKSETSILKRPILEIDDQIYSVGYSLEIYDSIEF